MPLSIAAYEDFEIFKVDIGSAFMRTPAVVDDVKHKWVQLDKLVVEMLHELQPASYESFIEPDGMLVE